MFHKDKVAQTPQKNTGKDENPSQYGHEQSHTEQTKAQGLRQETDKTYGGGRWGQRTPKTAKGGLSHGEQNGSPNHNEEGALGRGRDYNEGSDDQRYISGDAEEKPQH